MKPIALYASPECCKSHNLNLYKGYFNVAWFVHAYAPLLASCEQVFVTDETLEAVTRVPEDRVDEELLTIGAVKNRDEFRGYWRVPANDEYRRRWGVNDPRRDEATEGDSGSRAETPSEGINWTSLGDGFEAQVRLAAKVAKRNVDRVLMFQDPDDVYSHLPEAYALIRNCTLANVSLNINAGATMWAESAWDTMDDKPTNERGPWVNDIRKLLLPSTQEIAFIAHDQEKERMSRFVYHYRRELKSDGFLLTGTAGTCDHVLAYLQSKDTPHWEVLTVQPKGAADGFGHGPTGGDVVIADEIIDRWTREKQDRDATMARLRDHLREKLQENRGSDAVYEARVDEEKHRMAYKAKPLVRRQGITHTVLFFIDHKHAQPHQADIHVLLRTCLHPAHGVLLLLNERTAVEWGQLLHDWHGGDGGRK